MSATLRPLSIMPRDLSLWHGADYQRRGDAVIAAAWRNPATKCWRCDLTHAEYAAAHGEKAARWTRGHVIDGDPRSPLAAEHARCNYSAGGRLGRASQLGRRERRSPNG